ncbi:hypothetical protein Y1Q_0002474 [Alligator mississippiensis]|uniref:Uncharacterized protein n=1 Tax=Alligator mississippiensis TaxID=8496 RepID=A0A151NBG3_ALLMI|nr:hypothetical protein Y1Q_0002474 [Alligator mississippiensis]
MELWQGGKASSANAVSSCTDMMSKGSADLCLPFQLQPWLFCKRKKKEGYLAFHGWTYSNRWTIVFAVPPAAEAELTVTKSTLCFSVTDVTKGAP